MANRVDIVRHPTKVGEDEGIYLGWDAQVSERGWWEAEVVVKRLAEMPHDLIACSELPRSQALAKMYGDRLGLPVQTYPILNEIKKPAYLVGLQRTDPIHVQVTKIIRDAFAEDRVPMLTEELQVEIKKRQGINAPLEIPIESRQMLEEKAAKTFLQFENFTNKDGTQVQSTLAISHAKNIASLLQFALLGTLKGFYTGFDRNLKVSNTGISTFIREPDRRTGELIWKVGSVNDTSHIDRDTTANLQAIVGKLE